MPPELLSAAQQSWDEAVELGEQYGVRNSQATVLAPTGTIGLMMDCDTTGIEPDLALMKAKKLVGGGTMFIVNQTIPRALRRLGYTDEPDRGDHQPHRRGEDDHRRAGLQPRAPAGVRVLDGRQHDPLHGSRHDDGCGPAVHLGRDLQDREHARGGDGRRGRAAPHRGVASRAQGRGALPRQLQGRSAALHAEEGGRGRAGRARGRHDRRVDARAHRRAGGRARDRAGAGPSEAAAGPGVEDVLVPRRRLPRVRDGGRVRGRPPRRAVPQGRQAGLDALRDHGRVRDLGEPGSAVRRAARRRSSRSSRTCASSRPA